MQYAFLLNADRSPMQMLSSVEARRLLNSGKCAVLKRFPFTLIHKQQQKPTLHPEYHLKIDPGSRFTGLAILEGDRVVWGAEVEHRGWKIKDALESRRSLRRGRRNRKTRYRKPRFDNRTRQERWIPPSLKSRVENTKTWVLRLLQICPITAISMESVRFDTQEMQNPEVSGVEYQQGELLGYEVREYLLEKWNRTCAYCGAKNTKLEVEHIQPRSKGGSDRVSNLALACRPCNEKKGNRLIEEFLKGKPDILKRVLANAKASLKDATAVNVTRGYIQRELYALGLNVNCKTGGQTKFNRCRLNLPKTHWLDAACVGDTPDSLTVEPIQPLQIKAMGHGSRRMMSTDKFGFPKGSPKLKEKRNQGFRTGDMAIAVVPKGRHKGTHVGRVTIRKTPSFAVGKADGIHPKYMRKIHSHDGYGYALGQSPLLGETVHHCTRIETV